MNARFSAAALFELLEAVEFYEQQQHGLTPEERERIIAFARKNRLEGHCRLTYMMIDANVVACSPASTYRVLKAAGMLAGSTPVPSKKGTGFVQPLAPHEHWHVDISYINVAGTFLFLCGVLDGCSRYITHWEIREKMEERDVETIVQKAREAHPGANPRIITDNGPQFIAKDFKEFIRMTGMTHVRTSPYYPQSNGKIERWHKTLKADCIRPQVPLSDRRCSASDRLRGRPLNHLDRSGASIARLPGSIGVLHPATRTMPASRINLKHNSRLLRE
jgi:transposase InsO family protein